MLLLGKQALDACLLASFKTMYCRIQKHGTVNHRASSNLLRLMELTLSKKTK